MFFLNHTALFVTGTDTGVGKTVVTALLALKMRQLGVDCTVFKPFASGCRLENGVLVSEDAEFLRKALDLTDAMDEICPIRLEEPLAPLIAARRAGISTAKWPQIAREAFQNLRAKHQFVIVEGVGGVLAPIWENEGGFGTNFDLMRDWDLPAVLVARRGLGTINHSLLALQMPAKWAGIVFNDAAPVDENDIAAQSSPAFIAGAVSIPIWGQIPCAPDFEAETLNEMTRALEIRLE